MIKYRTLVALAEVVSAKVYQLLPAGFNVHAQECTVSVSSPGRPGIREIDLSPLLDSPDAIQMIEVGALRIMNDTQDEVIDSLAAAWPTDCTHPDPATPYVETTQNQLHLGYRYEGNADHPAISFSPIELVDLGI